MAIDNSKKPRSRTATAASRITVYMAKASLRAGDKAGAEKLLKGLTLTERQRRALEKAAK